VGSPHVHTSLRNPTEGRNQRSSVSRDPGSGRRALKPAPGREHIGHVFRMGADSADSDRPSLDAEMTKCSQHGSFDMVPCLGTSV
jgi:hypothetical protein